MPKAVRTTLILFAALATAGCSRTPDTNQANGGITVQNGAASAPTGPAREEKQGQDFVATVLGRYDFAAQSARVVAERADRPEAKQYAAKLASDLQRSREELAAIATAGSLKIEATPVASSQADLAVLGSARGAPLESAFAERQLDNMSQLVGLMRAYGDGGDNPALKAWAAKDQALVNERLSDLQTLDAQIKEAADK